MRLFHRANHFFFDADDQDEQNEIDVWSCVIFYGSCAIIGTVGIVTTIANVLH